MSNLKPIGEEVILDGQSRHLLFTFNAINEIQEHLEETMEEAMDALLDPKMAKDHLHYIFYVLLNDEYEREAYRGNTDLKKYTFKEIGWFLSWNNYTEVLIAVLKAYGLSLPEADEFENPNARSATQKVME